MFILENGGVLKKLPSVTVSEDRVVIPAIRYRTNDGVIQVKWCHTCHFYRFFSSAKFTIDPSMLIIVKFAIVVWWGLIITAGTFLYDSMILIDG